MQTWIPSLPHVNSYLPPQRTNLNLGKWDTADYISAQVQLSLKCIPSWGPGYLNEALRVKISWEIGKWIIECDHYIIQSWKEIHKWTQTGDIHFLINRDCAVMIVDIIDGFERCCSHSSNFPMYSLCIRPIFWSISLHLGLIKLEHISFCIIGTIWSEESIHSHHPLSPLEIACEEIFSCVIQTYWLVTILTMDKIHRYHHCPSVPILFIRGCSQLHTSSIPRSHLNLKSSNILPSPPPILIDILHPPPVMDRLVSTFWHSLQSHLESVLLWEA